jgi:hypothetical protein
LAAEKNGSSGGAPASGVGGASGVDGASGVAGASGDVIAVSGDVGPTQDASSGSDPLGAGDSLVQPWSDAATMPATRAREEGAAANLSMGESSFSHTEFGGEDSLRVESPGCAWSPRVRVLLSALTKAIEPLGFDTK